MFWSGWIEQSLHHSVPSLHHGRASRLRKTDGDSGRTRRGFLMFLPLSWRRCALGSNHIASHGVWRIGRRRAAKRLNRRGETRWHLCRRMTPAISFPGNQTQGARA